MKINSFYVNFLTKRKQHIPIRINGTQIPFDDLEKYLDMTLDKLRCRVHDKKKRN